MEVSSLPDDTGDFNEIINRVLASLVRRRWWIVIATTIVSLGTIAISLMLPHLYRSEATIFVEKERIPDRYVVANSTRNAMDTIDAMTHEILSRARLLQIIDEFGLYPKARHSMDPALLVEMMRGNIEVQPLNREPDKRATNAFLIAFTCDNPRIAQQVTGRLTALFIQENQQAQQTLDTSTTKFLETQLEAASADLAKQDEQLKDYKMRNLGQLPEQEQGNLTILSGLQLQLQAIQSSLSRARQQRTYLESMLAHYSPGGLSHAGQPSGSSPIATRRAELSRLRAERDDLLSRYSEKHPDVISINEQITAEEARLNALVAAASVPASQEESHPAAAPMFTVEDDPASSELKSQRDANRSEIADAERESAELKTQIAGYQQRLNFAPVHQQQIAEVIRDYDSAKQNYADLLNKKTQSELATKLAMDQRDRQFQVIDPPTLPLKPSSPAYGKFGIGGLAGGLVLGFALAFFMEARDRSFHLERNVRGYFGVPVVVGVPPLFTEAEERQLAWRKTREWALATVLFLLVAVAQLYVLQKG